MSTSLDDASAAALQHKIETYRKGLNAPLEELMDPLATREGLEFFGPGYDDFPVGHFLGLDQIRLRWLRPNWFEYLPAPDTSFGFVRASGETIQPGRMFTDGGSIPNLLSVHDTLSAWGYAPAFLTHDWEFARHHDRLSDKSFEDVRDTMMESVKTLMETGVAPKSRIVFRALLVGIDSFVARLIWNRTPDGAVLPPNNPS